MDLRGTALPILLAAGLAVADEPPPTDAPAPSRTATRAELTVEIAGELRVAEGEPPLPLTLTAAYGFLDVAHELVEGAVVRRYTRAGSTTRVADAAPRSVVLRRSVADQRVYLSGGGLTAAPLAGPLTPDERGLLELPCDPVALRRLVDSATDDDGRASDFAAAAFLGLDVVRDGELAVAERDGATVVTGTVGAADDGASATVTLALTDRPATDSAPRTVTLKRTDERAVGPVSPGMSVTTRATLTLAEVAPPADLAAIDPTPPDRPATFTVTLPAGASVRTSPEWVLFFGDEAVVVMRLMRAGRPLAQVNVTAADRLAPGEHTPDARFAADVRNGLAAQVFGETEVDGPAAAVRDDDVRVAAMTVAGLRDAPGVDSDRMMTWDYRLLTAPDGRQLSVMFTLDRDASADFAGDADAFVDAITFGPAP